MASCRGIAMVEIHDPARARGARSVILWMTGIYYMTPSDSLDGNSSDFASHGGPLQSKVWLGVQDQLDRVMYDIRHFVAAEKAAADIPPRNSALACTVKFYGAVHLATATLVQNFHAMGKNTNLFSSCRNAPFKSTNQSSRGIIFKCKLEWAILPNQAQIGHYIQMLMYIN